MCILTHHCVHIVKGGVQKHYENGEIVTQLRIMFQPTLNRNHCIPELKLGDTVV